MSAAGVSVRRSDPVRTRIGIALLFLANGTGYGAWAASIAAVKLSLGLSAGALGGALLCVAAGAIVAMPVAGWLGALNIKRLLTATGVAMAGALLLPGLAPSLFWLAGALFLLGAASGALDVCMNARASRFEQGCGHAVMSSFHAAFSLGGLLGTVIVAACAVVGAPLEAGLLIGALLLGACIVAHAVLDPDPRLAEREAGSAFAWPGRALLGIGLLCLLAFMTEGAIADWSGVFMRGVAGFSAASATSGYAAFSAAMVAARLLGDRWVRRFGPVTLLRAGGGMAGAGVALAIAAPAWGPLGFGLVGLGCANMAPVLFSSAGRAGPAASTGVAAVATLGYGGMLFGPPLIGALADGIGLRLALSALAAAMLAIALTAGRATR